MAKKAEVVEEPKPKKKAKAQSACPLCGGTVFSRQREIGQIVDGKFKVEETLYKCQGCGKHVSGIEELTEVPAK